jgi:streptogramin lyase
VDSNCTIWAADYSANGYLIKWVPSQGQAGMQISSQGSGARQRGVNVDLSGNVWTSDTESSTLIRWNPEHPHSDGDLYVTHVLRTHSGIGITFGGQIVNPSFTAAEQ